MLSVLTMKRMERAVKVEAILQRFLESPMRRFIVITLTLAVALVGGLPAADEFLALRSQQAELATQLVKARSDDANLPALRTKATATSLAVAELQGRTVSEEGVHKFRNELVNLCRKTGCHLRRAQVSEPRSRAWHQDDSPLERTARRKKSPETGYDLVTHDFAFSVSGSVASVKQLLDEMGDQGKLLHTESFNLRPLGGKSNEVVLEVQISLYSLRRSAKHAVAA